jgi:hypothetical protein
MYKITNFVSVAWVMYWRMIQENIWQVRILHLAEETHLKVLPYRWSRFIKRESEKFKIKGRQAAARYIKYIQ